jgi:NAD(P)-dependent dehydrogenase (short-subunit alcohol dehydrogenase family)
VAVVAGATRGASRAIAIDLARRGVHVYATGRSSRISGPSEFGRPECIEDVGEAIAEVGSGRALRIDHLDPEQVRDLARMISAEHGRLDLLVIGLFGADHYAQFGRSLWEHDLDGGLRMLRIGIDSHLITAHALMPLMTQTPGALVIELTDGTSAYNRAYRHQEGMFYDLTKAAAERLVLGLAHELRPYGAGAVGVTPGWLRSEAMLEHFGVREDNWRDALHAEPHFAISETPSFVARGIGALAVDPDRTSFSGLVLSSYDLAQRYNINDLDGSRPDAWRYVTDVADAGKSADTTGYR